MLHHPLQSRQAPEIKSVYVTTRLPAGAPDDLGAVIEAFYIVDNGVVTLCDQDGKETETSCRLAPGDDPGTVAGRLKRRELKRGSSSPLVATLFSTFPLGRH
jgi:hypothetical protein